MTWPDSYINQIICGNSLKIMKEIPPKSIDVIITDPVWPGASPKIDIPGRADALDIFNRACFQFSRLTNRLIVHLGQTIDPRILSAIPESLPFAQLCWLEWVPPHYKGPVLVNADIAYVFGHKKLPGDGSRVLGSKVVSHYQNGKRFDACSDPECPHPTPRSITHVSWLVNRFSRPGDIILDPFCGSGTTCVAAKLAGRRYIGIDIWPEAVDFARKRVNEAVTFFTENIDYNNQTELMEGA